eukprot:SAG22_NODE_18199_length_291_cov_0.807292_1_plen_44_part_10
MRGAELRLIVLGSHHRLEVDRPVTTGVGSCSQPHSRNCATWPAV